MRERAEAKNCCLEYLDTLFPPPLAGHGHRFRSHDLVVHNEHSFLAPEICPKVKNRAVYK